MKKRINKSAISFMTYEQYIEVNSDRQIENFLKEMKRTIQDNS